MFFYPADISPDGSTYAVQFRDIPEALTCGDTIEEAVDMAKDALATAMDFYFEDIRTVPLPSAPQRGETLIALPASIVAKVLLLNAMIVQDIVPSELTRRREVSPQDVNCILDLHHATQIDTVASALAALGLSLNLGTTPMESKSLG